MRCTPLVIHCVHPSYKLQLNLQMQPTADTKAILHFKCSFFNFTDFSLHRTNDQRGIFVNSHSKWEYFSLLVLMFHILLDILLGKGAEKKTVFFMVFCQTGGREVSEGSEKTIMLF